MKCLKLRTARSATKRDKCEISWLLIKEKGIEWDKDTNQLSEFKSSNGWLNSTLKRYGISIVSLYSEAADVAVEVSEQLKVPRRLEFKDLCDGKGERGYLDEHFIQRRSTN